MQTIFFGYVHQNFLGVHNSKQGEVQVVSVRKPAFDGQFMALKTTKKSTIPFPIPISELLAQKKQKSEKISFEDLVAEYLNANNAGFGFYPVYNPEFSLELKKVETKHHQNQKGIKIAFLYSKGGEQTLQDFFNKKESDLAGTAYFRFLDLLGQKIQLLGWKKYRGDIGVDLDQSSYYTEWRGIEVMFHICLWMNSEQHRRLIGNDVVFVIFHEEGTSFDPGPLDDLGTVPQVFLVVQPVDKEGEFYRIGIFTRPNIKAYAPYIPAKFCFHKKDLKDFLFTKVYNGYCQSLSCPPMNRLFEVPRGSTIADFAEKYHKQKIREKKTD